MLRAAASGRRRPLASLYRAAVGGEGALAAARAAAGAPTTSATVAATTGTCAPLAARQGPPLPSSSLLLQPWWHQHQHQQHHHHQQQRHSGLVADWHWWQHPLQQQPWRRRDYASAAAGGSSGGSGGSGPTRLEAASAAQPERVSEPSSSSGGPAAPSRPHQPHPHPNPNHHHHPADKRAERAAAVAAHKQRLALLHKQQMEAAAVAAGVRLQQQQRQQLLRNAAAPAADEQAAAAEAAAAAEHEQPEQQQQQQLPRPAQQLCRIVQYVRSGVEVSLRVTTTPGAAPFAGVDASAAGAAQRAAATRLKQQQHEQAASSSSSSLPNDFILEWSRRSIPSADALGKPVGKQQQQQQQQQQQRAEGDADPSSAAAATTPPHHPLGPLARLRERGAQATLRAKKMLQQTFLPAGYPSSVGAGYVEFAGWQAVTNLATTANGVLASTFLLYSVGLGAGAIPTAGALNWVLKDGLGQVGTLLFGKAVAHNFDIHSKTWYFLSLVLLAGATGLEIATFVAPSFFLALGSAANAVKGLSWMAGGSTRSVFNLSFVRDNNIADITAKGTSQYIFASLFGTTAGVSIAAYVGQSPAAAAAAFGALSALSLYGGFRTVKSIPLPTLNSTRLQLLAAKYLKCIREGGDTARSVAAAEAAIAAGSVSAASGGGLAFLRNGSGGAGLRGSGRVVGSRYSDFHDEEDLVGYSSGSNGNGGSSSNGGNGGLTAARLRAASSGSGARRGYSPARGGGGFSGDSDGAADDDYDEDDGGACGIGPAPIEMSASAMRSRRAALVATVQRRRAALLSPSSPGRARASPPSSSSSSPRGLFDADDGLLDAYDASSSPSSSSSYSASSYLGGGGNGTAANGGVRNNGGGGDDYQREYRLPDEDDDSCEATLPSPLELAAVDPPLPWLMGDQRILNPAIRVGTALDALVGGSPDLLLVLMSTFRYEKALVVPGNAAGVAAAAAAGRRRAAAGGQQPSAGSVASVGAAPATAAPGDVHVVLHADAAGPDIVQAYLQACILRKRLKRGTTVAPGDLAALRLVLHDTLLASKRLTPAFMRALERQGWMTDKIVVEAHRRRARW